MSWSFDVVVHAGGGDLTGGEVMESTMRDVQQQAGEWGPETRHQAQAAVNAALQLLASGALGRGNCLVGLSGHANPGHDPAGNSATDHIFVRIQRLAENDPF